MAEELRSLRISRQIPAKEMVAVVQEKYPKYDKTLQSKCERGDEYGIQLRQDAMAAILAKFSPLLIQPAATKKGDGHKLTSRISCRLSDEEYAELQQFIKADGFDTMQAWLTHRVRNYIKRKRKAMAKSNN